MITTIRPSRRRSLGWALMGLLGASLAGCVRVHPDVNLPVLRIEDPVFRATLAAYAETPVVGGNRVDILLNGDQIFPAKLAAIRAARGTVNYAQYVFEEGQPSSDIVRALAERCRAGVKVNVLIDAVGALAMPEAYREAMTDAGCRLATYHPLSPFTLDRVNNRNHRRILVVDGRIGITGGSGTSGKWGGNGRTKGHWRDTDARVEGPVVEQLQGAFAKNWLDATGEVLGGTDYFPRSTARGSGLGAGRAQLAHGGQHGDGHHVPPGHLRGPAIDLHHEPLLRP
jgi:cardiolipin synthase